MFPISHTRHDGDAPVLTAHLAATSPGDDTTITMDDILADLAA